MKFKGARLINERGSFLTEFTLVLPLMLVLFIGSVDLSVGMLTYLRTSRVAYEAARYGSSLANMSGTYDSAKSACEQAPYDSETSSKQLGMVITRAQRIMGQSILFFSNPNSVDYRVSYEPTSRQIHVCLIVPWQSLMPGFMEGLGLNTLGGSIKTTASAPYLFSS